MKLNTTEFIYYLYILNEANPYTST